MDWNTVSTVVPTALSATFYVAAHTAFLTAMARRKAPPLLSVRPWVSILKPIAGADDDLRGNLESFADLDYPAYEILFGVASAEDPAVPVVQAFLAAHPRLSARLVWTTPADSRTLNPKVAQLLDLTRAARGSVIVVSDANVRVPRTYLRSLTAALLQPGVGLVSSVIVGGGERSLGAALENAQLGAHVAPAVVAAVVGILAPSPLAAKIWGCALGLQVVGALLCFTLLRAKRPWLLAALEPLRAAVILLCWGLACMSRRVDWRGNVFSIEAGSKLVPVRPARARVRFNEA